MGGDGEALGLVNTRKNSSTVSPSFFSSFPYSNRVHMDMGRLETGRNTHTHTVSHVDAWERQVR